MIRAAVRDAIREELADLSPPEPAPEFIDRAALAKELSTSVATIDRLCRDYGLPYVRLGDCKRFRMADVREWLAARSKGGE